MNERIIEFQNEIEAQKEKLRVAKELLEMSPHTFESAKKNVDNIIEILTKKEHEFIQYLRSKLPERILTDKLLTLCRQYKINISYCEKVYYYNEPDEFYSSGWYKKISAYIEGFHEVILSEVKVQKQKEYEKDITDILHMPMSLRDIVCIIEQHQLIKLSSIFTEK